MPAPGWRGHQAEHSRALGLARQRRWPAGRTAPTSPGCLLSLPGGLFPRPCTVHVDSVGISAINAVALALMDAESVKAISCICR